MKIRATLLGYGGIDLEVVLGGASGSYRAEQAFRDLGSGTNIASVLREDEPNYAAHKSAWPPYAFGIGFPRPAAKLPHLRSNRNTPYRLAS
jgi:hypothetical protein